MKQVTLKRLLLTTLIGLSAQAFAEETTAPQPDASSPTATTSTTHHGHHHQHQQSTS